MIFCYNVYAFSKFPMMVAMSFLVDIRNIAGYTMNLEYKLPGIPVRFRNFDSEDTKEDSQTTNIHRIGFV